MLECKGLNTERLLIRNHSLIYRNLFRNNFKRPRMTLINELQACISYIRSNTENGFTIFEFGLLWIRFQQRGECG